MGWNSPNHNGHIPTFVPRTKASQNAALWLSVFILVQIACQIGLLFEVIGAVRIVARTVAFSSSLALLCWLSVRGRPHPSSLWGIAVLVILAFGLLHPESSSLLVGIAQICLYLAILAPLFWVGRLQITSRVLNRVIQILWAFHTLSAFFGILQTYFPGRFTPNVSTSVQNMGAMAEGLKITLANGEQVWRPMGLTDSPGGACLGGYYAFLLGLGFLSIARHWPLRLAAAASMGVGLCCIYLCQIRSVFLMALISAIAFSIFLFYRGETRKGMICGIAGGAIVVLAFLWALTVGGNTVATRFGSLLAERPEEVYHRNRGMFLEHTVEVLLPEYPLGAGLGRWGMIPNYFGDDSFKDRMIWVEIQLTGWLLDGGVPLILAYTIALFVACWTCADIALKSRGQVEVQHWAALILAYDVGALATTFNYPLFISQTGMEFWMLNACLFAASISALKRPPAKPMGKPPGVRLPEGPLREKRSQPLTSSPPSPATS